MGQLAPKLLVRTSNDIELLQKTILSTSSRGDSIAPPVIEAEPPLELHCPLKPDTQLVAHVPIAPIAAPPPPAQFIILDWLQSVELRRRVHTGLNRGKARNALAPSCVLLPSRFRPLRQP